MSGLNRKTSTQEALLSGSKELSSVSDFDDEHQMSLLGSRTMDTSPEAVTPNHSSETDLRTEQNSSASPAQLSKPPTVSFAQDPRSTPTDRLPYPESGSMDNQSDTSSRFEGSSDAASAVAAVFVSQLSKIQEVDDPSPSEVRARADVNGQDSDNCPSELPSGEQSHVVNGSTRSPLRLSHFPTYSGTSKVDFTGAKSAETISRDYDNDSRDPLFLETAPLANKKFRKSEPSLTFLNRLATQSEDTRRIDVSGWKSLPVSDKPPMANGEPANILNPNNSNINSTRSSFSKEPENWSRIMIYCPDAGISTANTLPDFGEEKFVDLRTKEFFWIDICGTTHADVHFIEKLFGVHPLTSEDILTEDTREKCEQYDHYLFVIFRTLDPECDASTYDFLNVAIIMFPRFVITFHLKPISHPMRVVKRMERLRGQLRVSSAWILYALMDDVVDSFIPVVNSLEVEIDSIEDLVLLLSESDQPDMLRRIGSARRKVNLLLRNMTSKREVSAIVATRLAGENSSTSLYFRDVQDHILAMLQSLEQFSDGLNRSHGNYLAQISVDLTKASNSMSKVMKLLSASATLFLPLTLVAGLFGMNVRIPGQLSDEDMSFNWFIGICVSLLVLSVVMCMVMKRWNIF